MSILKHHSKLFRRAAWLALFGIMLQVWAPVVAQAAMAAAPQSEHRICSSFAPASQDNTDQSGKIKTASCPICQSLHHLSGGFVPPHGIIIAEATREAERLVAISDLQGPKPENALTAPARAPPIPV